MLNLAHLQNLVHFVLIIRFIETLSGGEFLPSYPYSDNPATWNTPTGILYHPSSGYLWVADTLHHNLRRISKDGTVITIGMGPGPVSIDGVGASNVRFTSPVGLAFDSTSNILYISQSSHIIRKMTPDFNVTTIAGVEGVTGRDDSTNGLTATFNFPAGLVIDTTNQVLYIADSLNHAIRSLSLVDGSVSTLTGFSLTPGSSDGPLENATFNIPLDISIDDELNLYIADSLNFKVRKIENGTVTTFLEGGNSTEALFSNVQSIPIVDGVMYILDNYGRINTANLSTSNVSPYFTPQTGSIADGPFASASVLSPMDISIDPFSGSLFMTDGNSIRTLYTSPPPITTLIASEVTASSITVSWLPPNFFPVNDISLEFAYSRGSFSVVYEGYETSFRVTGLTPVTLYRFRVSSTNMAGTSYLSFLNVTTTGAGKPATPAVPYVDIVQGNVKSTFINLLWTPPDDNGASITSYRLEYQLGPNRGDNWKTYWNGLATSLTVTGLQPLSPYMFSVYAANSFGESDPSPIFYVSTGGYTCTQPLNADPPVGSYRPASYLHQIQYNPKNSTLLIVDNNSIREFDMFGNEVATYGSGDIGYDDGPGPLATMDQPMEVIVDQTTGIYYFTDFYNCLVRQIKEGEVSTIVGKPTICKSKDGDKTNSSVRYPFSLTLGGDGNLYVMEYPFIMRSINLTSGLIQTVAGNFPQYDDIDGYRKYASFSDVGSLATDKDGNILITGSSAKTVKRFNIESGEVTTILGSFYLSEDIPMQSSAQGLNARFLAPYGITVEKETGDFYIVDENREEIRKVGSDLHVYTIAASLSSLVKVNDDGESLYDFYYETAKYATAAQKGVLYLQETEHMATPRWPPIPIDDSSDETQETRSTLEGPPQLRVIYGVPPPAPRILPLSGLTASTVTVNWIPTVFPCMVYNYTLQIISSELSISSDCYDTFLTVTGLVPLTTYTIRVRAANNYGSGDWSKNFTFTTTEPGVPFTPTLQLEGTPITSANITWNPVIDNGSPVTSYTLQEEDDEGGTFTTVYQGVNTSCIVSNLKPLTLYRFQLYATNDIGTSQTSEILEVQTSATTQILNIFGVRLESELTGIAFDRDDALWFATALQVFRVPPQGPVYVIGTKSATIAVDGNDTVARFSDIRDLVYDNSTDSILLLDSSAGIRRITPVKVGTVFGYYNVTTIIPGDAYMDVTVDKNGVIYAENNFFEIEKWDSEGIVTVIETEYYFESIALDPTGEKLYALDSTRFISISLTDSDSDQVYDGIYYDAFAVDPSGKTIFLTDSLGQLSSVVALSLETGNVQQISADIAVPAKLTFDKYGFLWLLNNDVDTYPYRSQVIVFVSMGIPVPPLPPVINMVKNNVSLTLYAGSLHPVTLWELYIDSGSGFRLSYSGSANYSYFIANYTTYQFKSCAYNLYGGLCSSVVTITIAQPSTISVSSVTTTSTASSTASSSSLSPPSISTTSSTSSPAPILSSTTNSDTSVASKMSTLFISTTVMSLFMIIML